MVSLTCFLCSVAPFLVPRSAPSQTGENGGGKSKEVGVIRYYLERASEAADSCGIERRKGRFAIAALIKRYTMNSGKDTLSLDTAIVKLYFTALGRKNSDGSHTPKLDSQRVITKNYLGENPSAPPFFSAPNWSKNLWRNLYPDDPGVGPIAIGFESVAKNADSTTESGILIVNRSSFFVEREIVRINGALPDDAAGGLSRDVSYGTAQGFRLPITVSEMYARPGFTGRQYFSTTATLLKLELLD